MSAVYAIGPKMGTPLKIGYSSEPASRLGQVQTGCWEDLKFHVVGWVDADWRAEIIEQRCHAILSKAGKGLRGEWFNITPDWAVRIMDHAAGVVGAKLISHRQLIKKFQESRDPLAAYFWEVA